MPQARRRRPRALVKIAGILMQERRQHRPPNKDAAEPARGVGPETLSVPLGPLNVIWIAARLLDAGKKSHTSDCYRIDCRSHCQLKLQFGGERLSIFGVVDTVKVRNDDDNTLLLLEVDLCFI